MHAMIANDNDLMNYYILLMLSGTLVNALSI